MGAIAERLSEIARRCGDLSPLREPVRRLLWEGNRERALAGVDAQGRRYDVLAASTLEHRDGSGPPLAPRGPQSRIVTGYVVDVRAGVGRLSITGSWPELPWVEYHHTGGKRLPRRDPFGWREKDLEACRMLLGEHVLK